jgi:hypothetical protein
MTLSEKQALFCENVSYLIQEINRQGLHCTFGEAYRTAEQAEIYAKEGKGIAHSLHTERLAIDLNLISYTGEYLTDKKWYQPFGTFWNKLSPDNRWGGDFAKLVDSNHFEMQP